MTFWYLLLTLWLLLTCSFVNRPYFEEEPSSQAMVVIRYITAASAGASLGFALFAFLSMPFWMPPAGYVAAALLAGPTPFLLKQAISVFRFHLATLMGVAGLCMVAVQVLR